MTGNEPDRMINLSARAWARSDRLAAAKRQHARPLLAHPTSARVVDGLLQRALVPGYTHTGRRRWPPGSSVGSVEALAWNPGDLIDDRFRGLVTHAGGGVVPVPHADRPMVVLLKERLGALLAGAKGDMRATRFLPAPRAHSADALSAHRCSRVGTRYAAGIDVLVRLRYDVLGGSFPEARGQAIDALRR